MVRYDPLQFLPTARELPDSDDTPVDNELQNLIPNLLLAILSLSWSKRTDWFFGVDMGIYYVPGQYPQKPLVPDGFLSIGVDRRKGESGRLSYVLWEENSIAPILALEVVSQTYGKEYGDKMGKYALLGVKYYVVYNPDYWERDRHAPFEVYQLVDSQYVLQAGEPIWMPEVGLGIGRDQGTYKGWTREWLYWYVRNEDAPSHWERLTSPDEQVERERQRADRAEQQLDRLMAKLQDRGIDLEAL
jgi:Uma2 family endonuclease